MAVLNNRFEKGVGVPGGIGEFFVAEQCIDCDLCRQMAPAIFGRKFSGAGSRSTVQKQPCNGRELQLAQEALEACPVGAIQKNDQSLPAAA